MLNILKFLGTKLIPSKFWIIGGIVTTITFIIYLGFTFVSNMQEQLIELRTSNTILQKTLETQKNTIEQILNDNREINNLNNQLQTNLQDVERENSRLNGLFREHDLTDLANKKPGLIERRINDATNQVFNDIESITNN